MKERFLIKAQIEEKMQRDVSALLENEPLTMLESCGRLYQEGLLP